MKTLKIFRVTFSGYTFGKRNFDELDRARFNEQRVMFDNTGIAMNPSDGAGISSVLMVGSGKGVEEAGSKKAKRKEI